MSKSIPEHIQGLVEYLSQPEERANEDRALNYFRHVYGDAFTRQEEAGRADGYVPGSFVLELKGRRNDWLKGLFQGLAYKNKGLDFSQIVVAAKHFIAVWRVSDLPDNLQEEVLSATGAPNRIGAAFAKQFADRRNALLKLAIWKWLGLEVSGSLFRQPSLILTNIKALEKTLEKGRKVRLKVTLRNFPLVLKEMRGFFSQPVKAVRAFYSMLYGWNEAATVQLSDRANHKATLGGETISDLVPAKRRYFKEYVENRYIHLAPDEDRDDFFARYDEALDAVDRQFRIKHGIFFTDRDLSKFVMWFVKQRIPHLGKNYLVVDPACGSGNLVTNWRSPLELRHKVVSEIEPELLFGVQKRMQGDQWHNGKFTVVPKVDENRGLNFLDVSAERYLEIVRVYLAEKGQKPDKPLAFLCNPPYRSDYDQSAGAIEYKVHDSIVELVGNDASKERYCCFLAQMKLICEAAKDSGLPDESLLLLFTKSAWLTRRKLFAEIREQMLVAFEDIAGVLVKGNEFFDVKGEWPVAFTMWKYKGKARNPERTIPLLDLTWLKKRDLSQIPWDDSVTMEAACHAIVEKGQEVTVGIKRNRIKEWPGENRLDFCRERRQDERGKVIAGGLPLGDRRQKLKKAHGEAEGPYIGFMDDLTPCRIRKSVPDKPWFYLDTRFMSVKQCRCLSGPPTHLGYCARTLESAKRFFFWYALARTFLQHRYPMWIDADEMWSPTIPDNLEKVVFQTVFAITYAENECIQARFPANNPVKGLPELTISNPMTPLNPQSFWSKEVRPYCDDNPPESVESLMRVVNKLFNDWKKVLKGRSELPLYDKPYLLDSGGVGLGAGIVQIKAYAEDADDELLRSDMADMQEQLKRAKMKFFDLLTSTTGLNYFGLRKKPASASVAANGAARKARA
jgi:hypothetical protein